MRRNDAEVHLSSIRFDGIRFHGYSDDHWPPHLHAFLGEVEVVVEFRNGKVFLSNRKRNTIPQNAKRSTVKRILAVATDNAEELIRHWEKINGYVDDWNNGRGN